MFEEVIDFTCVESLIDRSYWRFVKLTIHDNDFNMTIQCITEIYDRIPN